MEFVKKLKCSARQNAALKEATNLHNEGPTAELHPTIASMALAELRVPVGCFRNPITE
jgi:hypothetical protein